MPKFKKVLIANRGEIALRIIRACREMGIGTVAVHSTEDASAMFVKMADESVCIGPAPSIKSYLDKSQIISAAVVTGADAIHPGYGFLSENAEFVELVEEHGIKFIGPTSNSIKKMGDKVEAKRTAIETGIPVVPGSKGAVANVTEALKNAEQIGYPVILKAASGGGGKGIKVVMTKKELEPLFNLVQHEAGAAFGDDRIYMEKFLMKPKHIEIQVLADEHGGVVTLGERDCSLQRSNQKVIEEAPACVLTDKIRDKICETVRKAVKKMKYYNAGTFEFLYENGEFFFMEMNTRLQVEHPVTEMVYGIDIVKEQIRIAQGEKLGYTQDDLTPQGHAIECRINAEDPETFIPFPGLVKHFHAPGGLGVRVDSGLYSGYRIPSCYDSMVAKVIVYAKTRKDCIQRAEHALKEFVVDGIKTTVPLHIKLLQNPTVKKGDFDILWLERFIEKEKSKPAKKSVKKAVAKSVKKAKAKTTPKKAVKAKKKTTKK